MQPTAKPLGQDAPAKQRAHPKVRESSPQPTSSLGAHAEPAPAPPVVLSLFQGYLDRCKYAASCTWVNEIQDAPTYYPSLQEFQDPMAFLEMIQPEAAKYGGPAAHPL